MAYNGWTNYETWNVKLWIDNDQGDYNYWNDQAQSAWDNETDEDLDDRGCNAARSLADMLKDTFEENAPQVEGMWADLLGAALSEVNWREIAESLMSEIVEDAKKEAAEEAEAEDE